MIFSQTQLPDVWVIDPERIYDHRGFFARTWCEREFSAHNLNTTLMQCNISYNALQGTLRGMHYQVSPYEETKLVRCTMGAIYDVIIDLRPLSFTYLRWISVELTAENRRMVYIPGGLAHGFYTLADNSEVFYQMSEEYHPESARGIRWNDTLFSIRWPADPRVISEKDNRYPDFHK